MAGATYLVEVGRGFAVGPALYGAFNGRRGGLTAIGVEAAWQQRLAGPLGLEAGLHIGGGGRAQADVGGGLMLRPHVDLLWDLLGARVGVSWSQWRFPDGRIDSRQFGLVLQADSDFRFVPRHGLETVAGLPGGRTGIGFDRVQTVATTLHLRSGARQRAGGPLAANLTLMGLRAEQALSNRAYWGLEGLGAVDGGAGGYAEFLAAFGCETAAVGDWLLLGARGAVGVAGGGGVDVGGGGLAKAGLYATTRIAPQLGLTIEAGYTRAFSGRFGGASVGGSLAWILDDPSDVTAPLRVARTEWSVGVERFRAPHADGRIALVQALALKADRYLTPWMYVTGQAHSAYGGEAGGFLAGLIGGGVRVPLGTRMYAGAELVAGGAGGGGIDNPGGGLVIPRVFVGADLTKDVALRIGAGRVKSWQGDGIDTSMVDAALVFSFGLPGRASR